MSELESYTTSDLCRSWDCTPKTIYNYVKKGKLVPFLFKPLTFSKAEISRFMDVRKEKEVRKY